MNLKKLREKAGLRLMDVATELSVAEASVRNWEHGRSVPRLEQVRQLLKLYNCSFDEFCDALAAGDEKFIGGKVKTANLPMSEKI